MKTPQGFTVSREFLRDRAPDLREALELMPQPPPRSCGTDLAFQFAEAMRLWTNGPLWMAHARERAGFCERPTLDIRDSGAPRVGDPQQRPALAPLHPDGGRQLGGGAPDGVQPPPDDPGRPGLHEAARHDFKYLTDQEAAALAGVGLATLRKAVFLTRLGHALARPGSKWWLPRAHGIRDGLRRDDVEAWIAARHGDSSAAAGSGLPLSPRPAITGGGSRNAPSGRHQERRPA